MDSKPPRPSHHTLFNIVLEAQSRRLSTTLEVVAFRDNPLFGLRLLIIVTMAGMRVFVVNVSAGLVHEQFNLDRPAFGGSSHAQFQFGPRCW
jgi:hypothetical protein